MASWIFKFKYLSALDLAGLNKYKYKSIDNSPLSNYVMHPFWNQLVKIFPLWLSANLITMTGWMFSLLIFVILSFYDPHITSSRTLEEQTVPPWVWLIGSMCIFLSHQLDGVDGKQARRTNTGSALGELFDHGLDSSTVVFMTIGILSLFGVCERTALHWEMVIVMYVVLWGFWIAHWEKYNTSVLFLPWAYDVSQIWLAGSYLATYIYGIGIWKETIYGDMTFPMIFKYTLYSLVVTVCIPMSIYNQYSARKYHPEDCCGILEGLMPAACLGIVTLLYTIFGYLSPTQIVIKQLRLYLFGYGILYSNITCRLIVSQMTGGICDRFNKLAIPLVPMIIMSQLKIVDDTILLGAYVVFLILAHLHYGINVVQQICIHLNIHCFKLGKRKKDEMNGYLNTNGAVSNKIHGNGVANGKVD